MIIGVRGVRSGGSWPTKIRVDTIFIRAKHNTFVLLTVSPNGTSIPDIHFGWGNNGDVHRGLESPGKDKSPVMSISSLVGVVLCRMQLTGLQMLHILLSKPFSQC